MMDSIIRIGNSFGEVVTDLIVASRINASIENGRQPAEEDLKRLGFPTHMDFMK